MVLCFFQKWPKAEMILKGKETYLYFMHIRKKFKLEALAVFHLE